MSEKQGVGGSNPPSDIFWTMRIIKKYPLVDVIHHTLFVYPSPINLTYLWNLGSCALFCLVIQIISGIFLAMHYVPDAMLAFNSVEHIMRDINYGWLIRYIHANGASMFFLVVYIHMFRGLYYSSYINPRELLWCSGVIILLLMIITAFMGYVLPWGQMSFWAATVITNLASAVPFGIGDYIVIWLWGGFSVSGATLNRFFSLHYLLPFILFVLVLIHLILLHENGSNNLTGIGFKTDNISFGPYFIWKDLFGIFILLFVYFFFVFFSPNYLGHSDNYIVANPLVTPTHIVPEWYFLPFYAILRSVPDKLFGVLLLLASILILILIPFIYKKETRSYFFKPFFKIAFWFFFFDCLFLGWLGGKPIEYPYLQLGQITTFFYFFYFIILLPSLSFFEKNVWSFSNYNLNYFSEKKIGALTSKTYAFKTRPWEVSSVESIDILDSLNSNIRIDYRGFDILRILPKTKEFINQEWITDSARFFFDSLYLQRILNPWLKKNNNYIEINLMESLNILKKKILTLNNTNDFIFSIGKNIDLFSFFMSKKLTNNLGSNNLFFPNFINNRSLFLLNPNFNLYLNFFLVNLNLRLTSPILNLNLLNEVKNSNKKVFLFGNISSNLSYDYIYLGNNLKSLTKLLLGKSKYSSYVNSKNSLFLLNNEQQLLNYYYLNNNNINNFNIFFYDNSLIHAVESNLSSINLNLKKSYLIYNLNSSFKLVKSFFKIYQGCHMNNEHDKMNLILPSSTHIEKKLYYINIYGYIQKTLIVFEDSLNLKSNYSLLLSIYEYYNNFISLSSFFIFNFYKNKTFLQKSKITILKKKKLSFNNILFKNNITLDFMLNNWTKNSKTLGIASQFFLKKKNIYLNV